MSTRSTARSTCASTSSPPSTTGFTRRAGSARTSSTPLRRSWSPERTRRSGGSSRNATRVSSTARRSTSPGNPGSTTRAWPDSSTSSTAGRPADRGGDMADLYDLGERPPVGDVPTRMHAYVVRQNRFGPPREAWRREIIPTPTLGPDEVLVYVMASGINYNNVWAALGAPLDLIGERQKAGEPEDFHAGGSDCSGIVWAVGRDVKNARVGDEVVVHSGWWRPDDPWVRSGRDQMLAESTRIWGYQTNYGSYGQFARCQAHQCVPKPKRLTWEAAGCFLLCGSTAYRMLMGWPPHVVEDRKSTRLNSS